MTKRYALTLLTALLTVNVLHAEDPHPGDATVPVFTWGARMGFAATGTYLYHPTVDGHILPKYTQDTQVGNFAAIILRINSKMLLVQSGVGLSYNKSSFSVDTKSWDPDNTTPEEALCSYSMLSMTVPLQLGFHIINRPPYCMSAFTGPRLRITPDKYYSVKYSGLDPYSYTDNPSRFITSWTAGLSVQIGRTFFDFEYEAMINKISGRMYETSGASPVPDTSFDRRATVMSFSYGIMF